MPEEKKMTVENENSSPAKQKSSPAGRTGNALAQVTMLDGTILDVYVEVSTSLRNLFTHLQYSFFLNCTIWQQKLYQNYCFYLQRKAKGQDLLAKVCEAINLIEKDYFGLVYVDRHDPRNWLDLDKRITKFLKSKRLFSIKSSISNSLFCFYSWTMEI